MVTVTFWITLLVNIWEVNICFKVNSVIHTVIHSYIYLESVSNIYFIPTMESAAVRELKPIKQTLQRT